jgi:hypothetical protein
MFRTNMPGRTARAIAAGALILSLTATSFAGSANAAPLADKDDCGVASAARSEAVHLLHVAWMGFASTLKALASDANESSHELAKAKRELKSVLMHAKEALEDLNCAHDDEFLPTPGAATTATTPASDNVKSIVEKAIKDMQAVVDAASKAVADTTTAAKPETTPDKVTDEDGSSVKGEKETANEDREDANDNDDKAKGNEKAKSTNLAKSTNVAKVKRSGRQNGHGNDHE